MCKTLKAIVDSLGVIILGNNFLFNMVRPLIVSFGIMTEITVLNKLYLI